MIRNFLFAYLGVSFFSYADVEATNDFFVECTQAKLYCHTMGEGNPLIFVHDGPGISHDYFLPQMAPLASQHRLYFYDQRGGGRSQGLLCGEHMNLDQFVSDLEQVRLATGSEKVSLPSSMKNY
jgi:proline iminopeptidase